MNYEEQERLVERVTKHSGIPEIQKYANRGGGMLAGILFLVGMIWHDVILPRGLSVILVLIGILYIAWNWRMSKKIGKEMDAKMWEEYQEMCRKR